MQDHFNDTEDVPLEQEQTQVRGTAQRRMDADQAWEKFYEDGAKSLAAEADLKEEQWDKANNIPEMPKTAYLQTKFEHEDDTEDISELVDNRFNEFVQLSYNHISHEADTEDIADDVSPSNYDAHHSKAWNDAVEKKAIELENEMKIEENMKLSQKKAKADAKKKAEEAKIKAEAEKRKKAQELADKNTRKANVQTIDLSELYKDMPTDSLVQLNSGYDIEHQKDWDNSHPYEHHSQAFYDRVDAEEKEYDMQQERLAQEEKENIYHYQTMGQREKEDMYDGIMLQTGYESHSKNYYKVESEQNTEWDNIEEKF